MTLRNMTKLLLLFVLGLPLMQAVLAWVEGLLTAMGDKSAATIVDHITTIAGALWLVTLVGLVVSLAIQSLDGSTMGGESSQVAPHQGPEPCGAVDQPEEG
jgi:hypothetical protein